MLLLLKSNVKGYTKRDGTVVKPHETKVVGKVFAPQFGIGKLPLTPFHNRRCSALAAST